MIRTYPTGTHMMYLSFVREGPYLIGWIILETICGGQRFFSTCIMSLLISCAGIQIPNSKSSNLHNQILPEARFQAQNREGKERPVLIVGSRQRGLFVDVNSPLSDSPAPWANLPKTNSNLF